MGDFERDTRIEEIDGAGGDVRRFRANLSEDWRIWGPNGGYLATIALRAVGQVARIRRPVGFAGHFLSVAEHAEAEVEVVVLRSGLYGNSTITWEFDGRDWDPIPTTAPPDAFDHATTYDSNRGRIVSFGGRAALWPLAEVWEY